MNQNFELVQYEDSIPVKMFFSSVDEFALHWHNEMEILFILKGSIHLSIDGRTHRLDEKDIAIINERSIHSIAKDIDDNLMLVVQIKPEFCSGIQPDFESMKFHCISSDASDTTLEVYDCIRAYLARITFELKKKADGYRFQIVGYLGLLISHLVRNVEFERIEEKILSTKQFEIKRINRIIDYIALNITQDITLSDIAKTEHLTSSYISHFFKKCMGIPLNRYITFIRLDRAEQLLRMTNKTITEISNECGFPNLKSFTVGFKEHYGTTPNSYRKKNVASAVEKKSVEEIALNGKDCLDERNYRSINMMAAINSLLVYLPSDDRIATVTSTKTIKCHLSFHYDQRGKPLERFWRTLATAGRAAEGLKSDWQNQLADMQKENAFQYIRFHGIFHDDMMVYYQDEQGLPIYNWSYVDSLLDFLMNSGILPFIELSYMPALLARTNDQIFWWKANIAPPKDLSLWEDLIRNFICHCLDRYGAGMVEKWYFEIWNEPDFEGASWAGTKEEYFEFYECTATAIKSISKQLKVGGPAIIWNSILESSWAEKFLNYCGSRDVPLDFFTFHIYPEALVEIGYSGNSRVYHSSFMEPDFIPKTIKAVVNRLKKLYPRELEIHITEWNASGNHRNLLHDTAFMAPFIVKNVIASIGLIKSMGFWTFTDIIEELKAGPTIFHGGMGLINTQGLRKPAYNAYFLLSKLGPELIQTGENYIITRDSDGIQILLYNYVHYDRMLSEGDWSGVFENERYSGFEEKSAVEVSIEIDQINGNFKKTHYFIDRNHGSVFDAWQDMGAPKSPNTEERNALERKSHPEIKLSYLNAEGLLSLNISVEPFGVHLITINKNHLN